MPSTPIKSGVWQLPCLNCGRLLDYETPEDVVECECGVAYPQDSLSYFRQPGRWRHWIANLSCSCLTTNVYGQKVWKVETRGDTVDIQEHRCRQGQVTPGSSN